MSAASFEHPLRNWTGPWTVVALVSVGVLALWAYRPPAPLPTTAPDTFFSADRAFPLVDVMAATPRPVGSAAHDSIRDFLLVRLRALGLQVDTQTAEVVRHWRGGARMVRVRNIMGMLPGQAPTGTVLVVAHYDGVPRAPAAADDGSGVAAILETLRAMRAAGPVRNDVVVLISDAEELGLMGAYAYAATPWPHRPSAVLNFEARGDAGPSLMFQSGPKSGPLIRRFAEAPAPLAASLFQEIYKRMPNDTDLSVFIAMGLPGLNFANGEAGALYHTPLDAPGNLSLATLQQHGDHALALVKGLGDEDLAAVTGGGPDRVYFYVPGLGLFHYPTGLAVPLALLLVAWLVGVAVVGVRRGRVKAAGVLVGFVAALLAMAAAAGLAAGLWASVRGTHPEWGTLIGAALYREGPYAAAVAALSAGVVFGVFLLLRRWLSTPSLVLGALLLPAALAAIMAFAMPGGAYIFLWPSAFALGMLAVLLRRPDSDSDAPATAGVMLVLAPGVLLFMAPLFWLVWVFLSIAAAPVLGAVAALMAVLLLPFVDALARPVRWWFPAFAALLAVVLVAIGMAGDPIDAQRPLADQLFYTVDRDSAQAWWATADPPAEPWSGRFVGADAPRTELGRLSLLTPYAGRAQPAPAIDGPGARAAIVAERDTSGRRVVTLEVTWPAGTMVGVVGPQKGARLLAVTGVPDSLAGVPTVQEGNATAPVEGRWRVERWDADVPFRITVDVPADSSLELRLEGYTQGLPVLAGAPPLARPADRMAAPRRLTDATIVRETRRF